MKLTEDNYKLVDRDKKVYHWEVSLEELQNALSHQRVDKLILSVENYSINKDGFHDPNYVLTLSQESADWLIENPNFNFYGTPWKSSDYKPGSIQRPIHNTLFKQAVILECLDLEKVPEGDYFIVSYPLRIEGASESPVTPVLFTKEELLG